VGEKPVKNLQLPQQLLKKLRTVGAMRGQAMSKMLRWYLAPLGASFLDDERAAFREAQKRWELAREIHDIAVQMQDPGVPRSKERITLSLVGLKPHEERLPAMPAEEISTLLVSRLGRHLSTKTKEA